MQFKNRINLVARQIVNWQTSGPPPRDSCSWACNPLAPPFLLPMATTLTYPNVMEWYGFCHLFDGFTWFVVTLPQSHSNALLQRY